MAAVSRAGELRSLQCSSSAAVHQANPETARRRRDSSAARPAPPALPYTRTVLHQAGVSSPVWGDARQGGGGGTVTRSLLLLFTTTDFSHSLWSSGTPTFCLHSAQSRGQGNRVFGGVVGYGMAGLLAWWVRQCSGDYKSESWLLI